MKLGSSSKCWTARDYEQGSKGLIHCRQTIFLLKTLTQTIYLPYLPFCIGDNIFYSCYRYLTKFLAKTSNTPLSKYLLFCNFSYTFLSLVCSVTVLPACSSFCAYLIVTTSFRRSIPTVECNNIRRKLFSSLLLLFLLFFYLQCRSQTARAF